MYQIFNFIDTLLAMMDVMPLACTMAVTTDPFLMLWCVSLSWPCICWLHAIFKDYLLLFVGTTPPPPELLGLAHVRYKLHNLLGSDVL
jgi:hypothetical protein